MVRSFVGDEPVFLCREDRYVAPMTNEMLAKVQAELEASQGVPSIQFT
jgi:hypothetical protein